MGDDATDYADVCDVLGLTISVMFSMYRQAQWPRLHCRSALSFALALLRKVVMMMTMMLVILFV